jgi:hypothetical protein
MKDIFPMRPVPLEKRCRRGKILKAGDLVICATLCRSSSSAYFRINKLHEARRQEKRAA